MVSEEIERLLGDGERVAVTIAEELEERRKRAASRADDFSRSLDELGAPLE